jgi:hypothetical protein
VHKPPKRQYADYYQIIERPVFLDEIKKKLDSSAYQTFESVKEELEVYVLSLLGTLFTHVLFQRCFQNAKRYNQKESQIWKDAKHLLVSPFETQSIYLFFCSAAMFRNLLARNMCEWSLRRQYTAKSTLWMMGWMLMETRRLKT